MAMAPHFEIEAGAERQRFELPETATEVTIGRSADCQWVIPSGAVSRRHAVLRRHGNELVVEDLGSSNGTMVNGERLRGPRTLCDQDKLQLGAVEIRVVIPEPAPAADETIAFDAQQTRIAPPSPPPPPALPAPERQHSGKTATQTAPPRPVPSLPSAPPPPAPSEPRSSSMVDAAAPSPHKFHRLAPASPAEATAPNMLELAVIAASSFLVVFGIGALLIRFVF